MPNTHEQQSALHRAHGDKTYCALLDEAEKGLADVAAGRSSDARTSILAIQARRSVLGIRNAPRTESIAES